MNYLDYKYKANLSALNTFRYLPNASRTTPKLKFYVEVHKELQRANQTPFNVSMIEFLAR